MRSNCVAVALRVFWLSLNRPPGREVYLWIRLSRRPRGGIHMGWGELDPSTDQLELVSFKPIEPVTFPWWHVWRHLRFHGEVCRGDRHHPTTQPLEPEHKGKP